MFFDPGTKTETKADPLSLDSLIAWLEKKPADKTYCYLDTSHCLAAQYYADHSLPMQVIPLDGGAPDINTPFAYQLEWIACSLDEPHETFGGALVRARTLAAQAYTET